MNTFKLGSSCSPAKCTSVSVRRVEEEDDVEDDTDPDRLVPCPFDKNHQIRACRFPYHYIKCQKNHPKLAQELKTCPFNARHLMPAAELSRHIANCANRSSVNTEDLGSSEVQSKWHVPVSTWENSECSEDWDKEIEASPSAPFIWGTSTSALNQDRTETRTTNSLPPGLRAPTTLPWKNWGLSLAVMERCHSCRLLQWAEFQVKPLRAQLALVRRESASADSRNAADRQQSPQNAEGAV